MKPVPIIIVTATALTGFGAGWWRDRDAVVPVVVEKSAPFAGPAKPLLQSAPADLPRISLPALETAADCPAFLRQGETQFAGQHPLILQSIRGYALRRWLELDAEGALAAAERDPGSEFAMDGFAADLFRVWLDLDVKSAVSAFTQASPVLARQVRMAYLAALADKDPALAYAEQQRTETAKFADWGGEGGLILRKWAQRDPRGALEKTLGDQKKTVLKEWARTHPAEALAYIKSEKGQRGVEGGGEESSGLKTMGAWILPALLTSDPAAAAEVIKLTQSHGLTLSAQEWVRDDARSALAWARSRPEDDPFAVQVRLNGAEKIATSDPSMAIDMLRALPDSSSSADVSYSLFLKQAALREAFASLAASDSGKARDLINGDPSLGAGGGMSGYLTFAFAADEAGAIAQCREWLTDPARQNSVYDAMLMAFRWGHGAGARDPSAVLAAIPELASRVDSNVLSGWAKTNPTGAAEFIAQRAAAGNPVPNLADEGVLAEIVIAQPEWTAAWLTGLSDVTLQKEAANTLAANWAAFDPAGAAGWLTSLPEGEVRTAGEAGFARRNESKPDPFNKED